MKRSFFQTTIRLLLSLVLIAATAFCCSHPDPPKKVAETPEKPEVNYLSFEDAFLVPPLTAFGKTAIEMLGLLQKKWLG